jgi:hypothetical protein
LLLSYNIGDVNAAELTVGQIQEMFVGDDYNINSKNITRSSGKK